MKRRCKLIAEAFPSPVVRSSRAIIGDVLDFEDTARGLGRAMVLVRKRCSRSAGCQGVVTRECPGRTEELYRCRGTKSGVKTVWKKG